MAERIVEDLQCPVCMERFNKPRILPCGHSFCEACLTKYIKKHAAKSKGFLCIVCRKPILPAEKDKPFSKWASLFPLNFSLASLACSMENMDAISIRCSQCQANGKPRKATTFCVECQEYMCNFCKVCHKKTYIPELHWFVSCDDEVFDPKTYPTLETKCSCKAKKELKVYCKTHDQASCSNCAESKHGHCLQTFPIDELTEEIEKQNMKERTKFSVEELKNFCKQEIKDCKEAENQLLHEQNCLLTSVGRYLPGITEMISRLEVKLTLSTAREVDAEMKAINKRTVTLEKILSELSSKRMTIDKDTSSAFNFLTYQKFEKILSTCEELYREKADTTIARSLDFDLTILTELLSLQIALDKMREVSVKRSTSDKKPNYPSAKKLAIDHPPGITSETQFIDPKSVVTIQPSRVGAPVYQYPSSQKLKRGCVQVVLKCEIDDSGEIRGLDFCADTLLSFWFGRRFVFVFHGIKENVRMHDTYGNCLCSSYIDKAWGIAMMGMEKVAVSQGRNEQIRILEIKISGFLMQKMTFVPSSVIQTNGACWGITYHDGHIFATVIRRTCKASIQIMNLTGEVKEVLWLTTGLSRCLTVDINNSNTIYVTGAEGEIYRVSRQGNVESLHDKIRARGNLTTDNEGNIYTCDNGNLGIGYCFVQIGADGENVKVVMSQEESPDTFNQIWYNKSSNSFFMVHSMEPTRARCPHLVLLSEYHLRNA